MHIHALEVLTSWTGFDPSWISLFHLAICSGTNLRSRRLVPIFYGNLRPAGAQTVWLLRFMLQLTTLLSTLLYIVTTQTNKKNSLTTIP